MKFKALTPELSIGPQIDADAIAELAEAGFKSIIGNRPDGEAPDQPAWTVLAEAAQRQGMEARHVPVVASAVGEADVAAFRDALLTLPRPIAAFCRTGMRSTILWALANTPSFSADDRIEIAARAGQDLEPFRSRLEAGGSPVSDKETTHAQA